MISYLCRLRISLTKNYLLYFIKYYNQSSDSQTHIQLETIIQKLMKKAIKKSSHPLIVDQYQKIKQEYLYQPAFKKSNYQQSGPVHKKGKIEEISCKFCEAYIPSNCIVSHEQYCKEYGREDQYDMHQFKGTRRQETKNRGRFNGGEIFRSKLKPGQLVEFDDYYPTQLKKSTYQQKVEPANKMKRPMSALHKKNQAKLKLEKRPEEDQIKLKKTLSSSKIKEQIKKNTFSSNKQKRQSKNMTRRPEPTLKNNFNLIKQQFSCLPQSNNSRIKKKNANLAQRPLKIDQLTRIVGNGNIKKTNAQENIIRAYKQGQEQKSQKNRQKYNKSAMREQSHQKKQIYKEERRKRQNTEEEVRLSRRKPIPIKRQQLNTHKQTREKLNERPIRQIEREPVRMQREAATRAEVNNRPQQQSQQSNQRQQRVRNTQRRQPIGRGQRRQNRERPNRNTRFNQNSTRQPNQQNFFNFVSQTINEQLQLMNSQFSMMSNIFENFSNYVNINIESHPHDHYQFSSNMQSSDQYNSDTSESFSSDYDEYYEDDSQPEGMNSVELETIQSKPYKVESHGHNQCTICLIQLKNGDIFKQLSCDHVFHSECIDEWLRRKSACPVCRDKLGRAAN